MRVSELADGSQLWDDTYTRKHADLMKISDETSRDRRSPRDSSSASPAPRERNSAAAAPRTTRPTSSTSRGAYQWNKRTEDGIRRGMAFFREAIELDPTFAIAYAGLADCFITLTTNIPLPPHETMPKAKAAALKAIEIDDTLADAWASLGAVRWWFEWDWEGAEEAYRRAIDLNPNYANAHDGYAMLLSARGRFDEAIEQSTKASELDPLSLIIAVHAGWPFYFARDYESAIRRFRKALELDEHFIPAHGWLGMALAQQHRYAEAIDAFHRALEVERISILTAMLAHTHAISGNRHEAESLLAQLELERQTRYISPYDTAIIYAGLGDGGAAVAQLRAAVEDRSAWMVFVGVDPRLDGLREEPGFRQIIEVH